jgi:hypothetical protein
MNGRIHSQGHERCAYSLSPKKYMQFRSVGWARPTPRAMRKLDTYAFVGAVVAIICFLWWLFTTVIR